jgi:hypothetical protein
MSTVAKARALSPTNAAEADALVRQLETLLVTGIESDVVAKNAGAARAKHAGLLTVNPKSADAARLAALIDNLEDPRDRRQTLRAVMRLYFRGNYAGALAELKVSATDSRDPAVAARFSFYRACTMAALALSTNPTNSSLMNEARSHYRAALSEAGAFASDLAYISPKILEELAR